MITSTLSGHKVRNIKDKLLMISPDSQVIHCFSHFLSFEMIPFLVGQVCAGPVLWFRDCDILYVLPTQQWYDWEYNNNNNIRTSSQKLLWDCHKLCRDHDQEAFFRRCRIFKHWARYLWLSKCYLHHCYHHYHHQFNSVPHNLNV